MTKLRDSSDRANHRRDDRRMQFQRRTHHTNCRHSRLEGLVPSRRPDVRPTLWVRVTLAMRTWTLLSPQGERSSRGSSKRHHQAIARRRRPLLSICQWRMGLRGRQVQQLEAPCQRGVVIDDPLPTTSANETIADPSVLVHRSGTLDSTSSRRTQTTRDATYRRTRMDRALRRDRAL